ncbi:MAG: hypothetical protein GF355_14995 [Candidatus Eisenbacteria bacterium]|nr:hypothetical protein [Candidatus Eisenbacteria bacterium]
MSSREKKANPQAFIGAGVCFLGAGIAITFALRDSIAGAGMGLFGLGVVFLVTGVTLKRKQESGGAERDRAGRPPS